MRHGWEVRKLGEVCETGAGGTPLKAHKDYYEGGTIPWLMSGEVSQGEILEAKNFITEKGLKNSSAKLFPPNTVLVAMYGATAGQVGILRFEASTNQAICGIFPNNKTIPEYLFYCFLSKKEELISQAVGGAQPNISQIKIKNTKIPFPSLPEQQRIVAILDECFTAIAKAKANAEQNLINAKELFESYLQSVFQIKGEDWKVEKLEEVIEYDKSPKVHKGLPYVGLENIESSSGKFLGGLTPQEVKSTTFYFSNKHVLYGRLRPYLNKVMLPHFIGHCSTEIFPIKVSDKITREFLYYWLIMKSTVKSINATWTGARMPRANMKEVLTFNFAFPSLIHQQEIVYKLDTLRIETKQLETIYQQKIDDLEELKKSILQKAFNGELKAAEKVTI